MNGKAAADFLIENAVNYGIDAIGVVNLTKLTELTPFFEKLNKGSIAFYSRPYSAKTDIKAAWKGAVSAVSFAVSYNSAYPKPPNDKAARGKIARAGLGEDYHSVLKRRSQNLMADFVKQFDCEYKIFVDTGPLSDRALAYCAGIGFYGKNNFIINPRLGSFIFLGSILLNTALPENTRFEENLCKNCDLCIKACPNNANGTRTLEYEKCVSYITQSELNGNLNGYVYGCDICQEVCPFNKTAQKKDDPAFIYKADSAYPEYRKIIELGKEHFEKSYCGSAMLWVGYDKIVKNCKLNLCADQSCRDICGTNKTEEAKNE